jgi:hypothetical protein
VIVLNLSAVAPSCRFIQSARSSVLNAYYQGELAGETVFIEQFACRLGRPVWMPPQNTEFLPLCVCLLIGYVGIITDPAH